MAILALAFVRLPLLLLASTVSDKDLPAPVKKGLETIRAEEAKAHIDLLASPEYGGRDTGEKGCEMAAEYLAKQLASFGIEPFGDEKDGKRTYFQAYPIQVAGGVSAGKLTLTPAQGAEQQLAFGTDFVYLGPVAPASKPDAVAVVDAGSYDATNVAGNEGRRRRNESAESAPTTSRPAPPPMKLPASAKGAWALLRVKGLQQGNAFFLTQRLAAVARETEAHGVLLVPDGEGEADAMKAVISMSVRRAARAGKSFDAKGTGTPNQPPRGASAPILAIASAEKAAQLVGGKAAFALEGAARTDHPVNVVGIVKGSDPALAAEYVVHSAHYDHVGMQGGELHPGADDNASGSSALLEIAQAYSGVDRPRRSVIFLWVSGEEHGLWGSEWFVTHPPVPLTSLVADLNTDMVGRSLLNGKTKPEYMEMTPSVKNDAFNTLAARALEIGELYGFPQMANGDRYWRRSDHYNFAKNGVPAMFLCNGEHEDYHRPGDTPDKIDNDKVMRSAKLCFHLGYETAMADARPTVLGKKDPASQPAK